MRGIPARETAFESSSWTHSNISPPVFNLEVEEDHTYFAGGLLVHNCDILAGQDLHGMGPGGYPKDAVPEHPHPFCSCTLSSIIDRQYLRRELARERGQEEPPRDWESGERVTGAEWLARQPEAVQRRMLGPTRLQVFRDNPARVIAPTGHPRPVHEVMGRAPQQRAATTVHVARPVVQADRANQVRPFPVLD
jgi:hypothetical protein